ncbi:MAG TPA: M23 family metallopeptidase [Longimicrobium sp.]|nr:M23 family metallopeptidase [Longimicrobium sp.]
MTPAHISSDPPLSRRGFLAISAGATALAAWEGSPGLLAREPATSERVRLLTLPQRVYKLRDNSKENAESWLFHLVVETAPDDALEPIAMDLGYLASGQTLETAALGEAAVAALRVAELTRSTGITGETLAEPVKWQVYRIRASRPVAAVIDEMRIAMRLRDGSGGVIDAETTVAIGTYTPKTSLIFPFRGRGFISQAQANDGGHANRSGQFAIDALGVDATYAPVSSGEDVNSAYVGWGRELIAPAAGTVVRLRADRPDQPVPNRSDPAYYAPEFPNGGDMGNHVVIDHGNGEFSVIAHMMAGSVLVTPGQTVAQGQPIGRLGNSGDTNGPHVHYQLQSGPDWPSADALPCTFTNVSQEHLVRGTWFTAT